MSISESIESVKRSLPPSVTLIAVSKTKTTSAIMEAYNFGQRDFGENKVQELSEKYALLPKDIRWHFIGHLQSNKVKYISPFIYLIHSVDSIKLLNEINKRAESEGRVINCLLQLSIADEESKFGFNDSELWDLFEKGRFKDFKHINYRGLMGMATNTDDMKKVGSEFSHLNTFFQKIKSLDILPEFNILSMGMTNDYQTAVHHGSNMVRIGSLIFGERN